MKKITAYKAFNDDMTCRGFQYEVGKTYEHEGDVNMCNSGFHACLIPFDCYNYYENATTFAEVELGGVSKERREDSKVVGASITITAKLELSDWIKKQVSAVVEACRKSKKSLADSGHAAATSYKGHAAATGDRGHAAATGDRGHAAATGKCGNAAATGYKGHAAATGYRGHAAATGRYGNAAATGDCGNAAATGYRGHAAATGNSGHAAATGNWGNAAATGNRGHAAATGNSGHAVTEGDNSIAASLGIKGKAKSSLGNWLVLSEYDSNLNLKWVKSAQVDGEKIKPDTFYRLKNGKFVKEGVL